MTIPASPQMTIPASPQRTATHWRVAVAGLLVMIGGAVPLSAMSFFHPYVISELYPGRQGVFLWYYTCMLLAIVASMLFLGHRMMTRIGPKLLVVLGSVIVAIALVCFSVSNGNPLTFYGSGILLGLGYGMSFQIVPVVWVNNWFQTKKGTALGVVMGGTGVGGMICSFLVPAVSSSAGWRIGYLTLAALVLVFPIPAALLLAVNRPADVGLRPYGASDAPTVVGDRPVLEGYTLRQALAASSTWMVYAAVVVMGIVHAGAQILAVYLQTVTVYSNPALPLKAQPSGETAFFSTLMMTWTLGLLLCKPLLGWLNDKLGILGAMLLTLGMQSLFFLYLPNMVYGSPVPLMFVGMLFMSAGMSDGTVQPPLMVVSAVGPRDFARVWAVLGTGYFIGMAVGAPLWGMVRDLTGSYVAGFYAAPVLLIGLCFLASLGMRLGRTGYTALEGTRPESVALAR